jgi:ribosome-binding factor A
VTAESGLRARRVGAQIREALTDLIAREVSDPKLAGLMITGVELPDDLGVARVTVRLLVDDAAARRVVMAHLERVRSRLRRGMGGRLRLKRTPDLRFVYDTGVDRTLRVEELLAEIAAEDKQRRP